MSIQPEDTTLQEADIDELTSHRSDDPRGMRRHKIQPSERSSRRDKEVATTPKKLYDHSPHEVFVQLDELQGTGEDREWKETARWIKYEEDVEEGSDRWGRPHVASLSFHSLLNLRRCLETGEIKLGQKFIVKFIWKFCLNYKRCRIDGFGRKGFTRCCLQSRRTGMIVSICLHKQFE